MITGGTDNSRLAELRKYTVSTVFANQYVSGGTWTTDGVDYANSVSGVSVVYYISGIRYVDETLFDGVSTTFSYTPNNTNNFIDVPYYKNMVKEKIISNPKINNDVFIIRDNLSAFDKNYRLEYIRNLIDLTTYAGGKYYIIINNT